MIESVRALTVRQLLELPPAILQLEAESVTEGFRFLTRLIIDWRNGSNRFDQPGECFLGVFDNGQLIAVGGLSCDPYATPSVGRLRRVYVTRTSRGLKVGRFLVEHLLEHAASRFQAVRLSTDTPEGAAFYLRCGFRPVEDDFATHVISFSDVR
ncbi:GNAT family N-acetyltransferase [Pseudomonas fluorescens]